MIFADHIIPGIPDGLFGTILALVIVVVLNRLGITLPWQPKPNPAPGPSPEPTPDTPKKDPFDGLPGLPGHPLLNMILPWLLKLGGGGGLFQEKANASTYPSPTLYNQLPEKLTTEERVAAVAFVEQLKTHPPSLELVKELLK